MTDVINSVAGLIAIAIMQEARKRGETISIPSLGITIRVDRDIPKVFDHTVVDNQDGTFTHIVDFENEKEGKNER